MDAMDLDACLPPRKRLLAGLKKKDSSDCSLSLPIPSVSSVLYARLQSILHSSSSPIEQILEEVNSVASDAAAAADAARADAMEKVEAAAKAKVAAKSALELVDLIRESDDRKSGSPARLQRATNGSPRVSKKSDKKGRVRRKKLLLSQFNVDDAKHSNDGGED